MDEIDAAVTLPKGASPIGSYARYYARRPDGKIEVVYTAYVRDDGPKPADYGCSIVTNDGTEEVPCPPDNRPLAGERRWVSHSKLPLINDGGCSVITVIYNEASHRVEEAKCNGF